MTVGVTGASHVNMLLADLSSSLLWETDTFNMINVDILLSAADCRLGDLKGLCYLPWAVRHRVAHSVQVERWPSPCWRGNNHKDVGSPAWFGYRTHIFFVHNFAVSCFQMFWFLSCRARCTWQKHYLVTRWVCSPQFDTISVRILMYFMLWIVSSCQQRLHHIAFQEQNLIGQQTLRLPLTHSCFHHIKSYSLMLI